MSQTNPTTGVTPPTVSSSQRFKHGFLLGVAATIAMSAVMLVGMATGLAPMPQPIPLAIAEGVLGTAVPQLVLMIVGVTSHLVYGGFWAGLLATGTQKITLVRGLLLGIGLWLLMQVLVLPLLGWGFFGAAVTPKIAVGTLVLHLIYGLALGVLASRKR